MGGSGSRITAVLTDLRDRLLRNRDCFLTEGGFAVQVDLVSVEVEETVVEDDLSLRLKRETNRRILKRERGPVQNISQTRGERKIEVQRKGREEGIDRGRI